MPVRKANAVWEGTLKEGQGKLSLGSGAFEGKYSFGSRFEENPGTNPEELIAGAHAGCFSMALNAALGRAGHQPKRISTTAKVHIEKVGEGFGITRIELDCEGEVPGIDDATFQDFAQKAKEGCIVSKALAAVQEITLNARLVS
ncbi:MAG TPA: OsmC family protein [Thermoanaerobaculia bacterium]|nr:OsmC family protein [Thermoanaerobaculia bacterium]